MLLENEIREEEYKKSFEMSNLKEIELVKKKIKLKTLYLKKKKKNFWNLKDLI